MPRRYRGLPAPLLAAAALLVVACGDDPDSGGSRTPIATPAPGSEDRLAQELVLDLDDFPRGWTHEFAGDEADLEQGPFAECNSERFPGETGRARGGQFSESDVTVVSVNPVVYVFTGRPAAAAALVLHQGDIECAVRVINEGRATYPDGERFANAAIQQIRLEGRDDITLYQVSYDLVHQDGTNSRLVYTIGLVVVDRTLILVEGYRLAEPFDPGLLEVYVDRQIEKVEDEL